MHDPILPLNSKATQRAAHPRQLLGFLRQADTAAVDYTSLEEFLNA
ncbi:MAG: hypothetical protein ACLUVB_04125 [Acutalibacteraceae bacterium]